MAIVSAQRAPASAGIAARLAAYDWERVGAELDDGGYAVIERALTTGECGGLTRLYEHDALFRSRVTMAHHGFGSGEYKYFAYPLPEPIADLRSELYARLAPVANRWAEQLGLDVRYPAAHEAFVERCHHDGQTRPTPLLLSYGSGDYNCLHQDLYGEHAFPLQAVFLLSAPGADFTGGEFVLTEQRPRMQSKVEVVPLQQGDAAIFAVNQRPRRGSHGYHRVTMRHGASRIRSGRRYTAGVIFHDAK